jgi:hypothetical protein
MAPNPEIGSVYKTKYSFLIQEWLVPTDEFIYLTITALYPNRSNCNMFEGITNTGIKVTDHLDMLMFFDLCNEVETVLYGAKVDP